MAPTFKQVCLKALFLFGKITSAFNLDAPKVFYGNLSITRKKCYKLQSIIRLKGTFL